MGQTYSTLQREMDGGQVYSSRRGRAVLLSAAPAPAAADGAAAVQERVWAPPGAPVATGRRFRFTLNQNEIPPAFRIAPEASGSVELLERSDGTYEVTGRVTGLPPVADPAIKPTLWLVHDLTVPADLSPADLNLLPHGSKGTGNAPGSVFTLDGNPPTYGPSPNTLSIIVSPGHLEPVGDGTWQIRAQLDPATNQAFHPLVAAGPDALSDMNEPMPSGTVAAILTDHFMRPATVHPELHPHQAYLQRLTRIVPQHGGGAAHLPGDRFTRAALTLEGLVRARPRLMPSREATIAIAQTRETP